MVSMRPAMICSNPFAWLMQASYLTSYISESLDHLGVYAILFIVITPVPSLISMLYLNPRVLTKFMLIQSATRMDVEVCIIKRDRMSLPAFLSHTNLIHPSAHFNWLVFVVRYYTI